MASNNSLQPPAVLIVEDEMILRMRAVDIVEDAGFTPGDDVEMGGIVFELDPGAPL